MDVEHASWPVEDRARNKKGTVQMAAWLYQMSLKDKDWTPTECRAQLQEGEILEWNVG